MLRLRRLIRFTSTLLWYGFVSLVVLAAVALTVARLVIPEVAEYRRQIETVASEYLGQPVRIAAVDARLAGMRPTLIFKEVSLLDPAGEHSLARFGEARVQIAVFESLRERRIQAAGLTVAGVRLSVTRRADGTLLVQGLDRQPGQATGASQFTEWLFDRDHLAIEDADIVWTDAKLGARPLHFSGVALRMRNHRGRHQIDAKLQLPVSLGRELEVAFDLEGPGAVPADWQGQFHLHGRGLALEAWGERFPNAGLPAVAGKLDVQLWGGLATGGLQYAAGEFRAERFSLRSGTEEAQFDTAASRLRWTRHGPEDWQLDLDALRLTTGERSWPDARLSVRRAADGWWSLRGDYLHVADTRRLLLASGLLPAARGEALRRLAPTGELRGLELRLGVDPAREDYLLRTRFSGLGWDAWERIPGIRELDGRLSADQDGGRLSLDAAAGALESPRLFRARLPLESARGTLQWRREGSGWRASLPDLALRTSDFSARLGMRMSLPHAEAPFLDLQLALGEVEAGAVTRYLPVGIMRPALIKWLDQALLGGEIAEAGLVYRGKLQRLPLRGPESRFLAQVRLRDLDLRYHSDWPRLRGATGIASFTDRAMEIELEQGRLGGNPLRPGRAHIADLKNPYLEVTAAARGEVPAALSFLAATPLGRERLGWLKDAEGDGPADVDVEVGVPLNPRIARDRPLRYSGQVAFRDSQLHLLADRLDLLDVKGVLHFDASGLRATGIRTRLLGGPAELDLSTEALPGGKSAVSLRGRGRLSAEALRARSEVPALRRLSGEAEWWGRLTLGRTGAEAPDVHLQISSELAGLGVDLPEPLRKQAADRRPFSLVLSETEAHRTVHGMLGDRAAAILQWEGSERRLARGALHFGGSRAALPEAREVRVTGVLEDFAPEAWRGLLGVGAQGAVPAVGAPSLPLAVDLDRLAFAGRSVDAGTTGGPEAAEQAPPRIPRMHGRVRELLYGDIALGEARFALVPQTQGIKLEYLSLSSPLLRLNASGDWHQRAAGPRSDLELTLAGDDIGALLDHLGYAPMIRNGRGQVHASLNWPGGPAGFGAESVAGEVRLHLEKGSIEEVQPGAGRLLGLFSLHALPRRLLLDFSDVFRKGFHFDSLTGSTRLTAGDAFTDDLVMEGPSARIEVSGRTGLVDKDYDHLVTVVPEVGGSLPLAGGLAWGPQVGAVILVFQKLFKPQIDRATQFQYRVTGSWESPTVQPIGSDKNSEPLPESADW